MSAPPNTLEIDQFPPHGEYWCRPTPAAGGNSEADSIHLEVGRCLSQWELIENTMAMIFQLVVQSPTDAAARAYGSIANAKSRLEALRFAAASCFVINDVSAEDVARLDKLRNHVSSASDRRNDIAHATVLGVQDGGKPMQFFLVPAFYASRHNRLMRDLFTNSADPLDFLRGKYRYTAGDIAVFTAKFRRLMTAALGVYSHLGGNYPQLLGRANAS